LAFVSRRDSPLISVNVCGASKVFTTCGSDEKVEFLKKLVNNDERLHVINYKTQSEYIDFSPVRAGLEIPSDNRL
jgi:hypothetical protein